MQPQPLGPQGQPQLPVFPIGPPLSPAQRAPLPIPGVPAAQAQIPVAQPQRPQGAPVAHHNVPVAPADGGDPYPSLISIFGSILIKTALVAALALAMIYPMVGLANQATSHKSLSTHAVVKFMALSMALGGLVSLIMTFIAVKAFGDVD